MQLQLLQREIYFPRRPLLMGIVNVNDDSFSSDGSLELAETSKKICQQICAGADFVDIGAESARTNREAISVKEELRRLEEVIHKWDELLPQLKPRDKEQIWPPVISLNTWRPEVVIEALKWQKVEFLNDMGGLPNVKNAEYCALYKVALLIMHMVGKPKKKQAGRQQEHLLDSMKQFFSHKIELACLAGLSREAIVLDPGLDFAKNQDDSINIMQNLEKFHDLGRPLLLPISRKDFIGKTLNISLAERRDAGTLSCLVQGLAAGISIYRIHNVEACWQALKVIDAINK